MTLGVGAVVPVSLHDGPACKPPTPSWPPLHVVRVTLEWRHLSYRVPVGRRRRRFSREILQDMSAVVPPGRLVAVMGEPVVTQRQQDSCRQESAKCEISHLTFHDHFLDGGAKKSNSVYIISGYQWDPTWKHHQI